jgi:hypothetical protein
MLVLCDAELQSCAEDNIRAYGLLDIREWIEHAILQFVEDQTAPIQADDDPVQTAIAQATNAALDNDLAEYHAAREREAAARLEAELTPVRNKNVTDLQCPF